MATSRLAPALALLLLCCLARTALAAKQQPSIQHVVVLVMENRAFDHMVGMKATTNVRIDGCPLHTTSPACGNRLDPSNKSMPFVFVDDQAVYVQPADPQHSILASNEQLFGTSVPQGPDATPLMDGFASSYAAQNPASQGGGGFIMKCFAPAHVPVLSTLIDEFALFNSWHSSVPGPTMVNRAFFDATTSRGASKNDVLDIILGYPQRTIYEDLDEAGATWRVYFQQIATSWQMKYTRTKLQNYRFFDDFAKDAAAGTLANYTFLDPSYFDLFGAAATDQHPDHDVAAGEELIRGVYEAVRQSPLWENTLLLITYDEHGGFFDHVPPPVAPNPDGHVSTSPPFNFTRLGVRVPAVAISPWIEAGTVINGPSAAAALVASASSADGSSVDAAASADGSFASVEEKESKTRASLSSAYEHSSVARTLHALFAPNAAPLTAREAFAAPFHSALLPPASGSPRTAPRTDCPWSLSVSETHRGRTPGLDTHLGALGWRAPSELQHELMWLAAGLAGERNATRALEMVGALATENDAGRWAVARVNEALRGLVRVPLPADRV